MVRDENRSGFVCRVMVYRATATFDIGNCIRYIYFLENMVVRIYPVLRPRPLSFLGRNMRVEKPGNLSATCMMGQPKKRDGRVDKYGRKKGGLGTYSGMKSRYSSPVMYGRRESAVNRNLLSAGAPLMRLSVCLSRRPRISALSMRVPSAVLVPWRTHCQSWLRDTSAVAASSCCKGKEYWSVNPVLSLSPTTFIVDLYRPTL